MHLYSVKGPGGQHAALAALLAGSEFTLANDTGAVFDDTPLAQTKLARLADSGNFLNLVARQGFCDIADAQRHDVLDVWRVFIKASRRGLGLGVPFTWLCQIMAARQLRFADDVAASSLLLTNEDWKRRYLLDGQIANILTNNGVGGPDLLAKLDDDDIGQLWLCADKRRPIIISLRDKLRQQQS